MRRYQRCVRYMVIVLSLYGLFMWRMRGDRSMVEPTELAADHAIINAQQQRKLYESNTSTSFQTAMSHNGSRMVNNETRRIINSTFSARLNATQGSFLVQSVRNITSNSTVSRNKTSQLNTVRSEQNETVVSETNRNGTVPKIDLKMKLPNGERPLLCLFTSFIKGRPFGDIIHERTMANWGSLSPYIWPYLFVSDNESDPFTKLANEKRWQAIKADVFRKGNLPVLKSMFRVLEHNSDSPFIGFANDDIIFDETLLRTLTYLKGAVKNIEKRDLMVIGRRRDYVISVNDSIGINGSFNELSALSHQLPLSGPDALDFVIFSRAGFRWGNIPDVVVGASAFINYVVSMALEWNYIVIEVTSSVDIVHQTEPYDRRVWVKGGDYVNDPNIGIIKSGHDNFEDILERGQTLCVAFITICRRWTKEAAKKNLGCNFALAKRKRLPDFCKVRATYHKKGPIRPLQHVVRHGRVRPREPEEYDTFEGLTQQF